MKVEKIEIRKDFPFFDKKRGRPNMVYFDNAATTQKPKEVIDAISEFYSTQNSNVHRGEHLLAGAATKKFELARVLVQKHINAKHKEEIIFTSGTTHAINLVAQSFVGGLLSGGDVILLSQMEHHSNIVPWQMACQKTGAKIKTLKLTKEGLIKTSSIKKLITPRVKLVVFQHTSNVTGLNNNVQEIVNICKEKNIYTLIDGAQTIAHQKVDVQKIDCDFYCFSGHKCFGPTGTGVLYGKRNILNSMPPYMGGGEMVNSVSILESSWNALPYKFEAGTPNISGFVGLGAAFLYIKKLGLEKIQSLEGELANVLYEELGKIKNIVFYSKKSDVPICTFNIGGIHSYDLGALLSEQGVCVRTGHLCAEPSARLFKTHGFVRASLSFYNTKKEVLYFVSCLKKSIKMLS